MTRSNTSRSICNSEKIKDNTIQCFTINSANDIVIGRRNGKLFAFNNSCPHRGASLSKGGLKGDNMVCYMHGYEYNVFTGKLENMKSWKKRRYMVRAKSRMEKVRRFSLVSYKREEWKYICGCLN